MSVLAYYDYCTPFCYYHHAAQRHDYSNWYFVCWCQEWLQQPRAWRKPYGERGQLEQELPHNEKNKRVRGLSPKVHSIISPWPYLRPQDYEVTLLKIPFLAFVDHCGLGFLVLRPAVAPMQQSNDSNEEGSFYSHSLQEGKKKVRQENMREFGSHNFCI